jgi:cell division protein FtsN
VIYIVVNIPERASELLGPYTRLQAQRIEDDLKDPYEEYDGLPNNPTEAARIIKERRSHEIGVRKATKNFSHPL